MHISIIVLGLIVSSYDVGYLKRASCDSVYIQFVIF